MEQILLKSMINKASLVSSDQRYKSKEGWDARLSSEMSQDKITGFIFNIQINH